MIAGNPPGPIVSIVRAMHEEVAQQLKLASSIAHPAESGRAREEIIRRFLRRFVPSGLAIDTGFIVDSAGGISCQMDIVIYRHDFHPLLEVGGIKHFLVESVIAVIENKANIETREALRGALNNVRSAKRLDRFAKDRNYVVLDFHQQGTKASQDPRYRVWTAIVAERGLSVPTFLEEIAQDMKANERSAWLDCFVDVHRFTTRYVDENSSLVWTPEAADAMVLTDPNSATGENPLVDFALLLAARLRHAAIIDYPLPDYFPMSRSHQGEVQVVRELAPRRHTTT